jgi:hypothetical protein
VAPAPVAQSAQQAQVNLIALQAQVNDLRTSLKALSNAAPKRSLMFYNYGANEVMANDFFSPACTNKLLDSNTNKPLNPAQVRQRCACTTGHPLVA